MRCQWTDVVTVERHAAVPLELRLYEVGVGGKVDDRRVEQFSNRLEQGGQRVGRGGREVVPAEDGAEQRRVVDEDAEGLQGEGALPDRPPRPQAEAEAAAAEADEESCSPCPDSVRLSTRTCPRPATNC